MASTNQFQNVVSEVQAAPQNQRTETLINSISTKMQHSRNDQVREAGADLENLKPQLIQACLAQAAA